MNNVLLGSIPSQNSGSFTVTTLDGGTHVSLGPPNPDGTYNISIPDQDKPKDGVVVAKETDAPEGDGTGTGENGDDNGNDQMKKMLPIILAGAAVLFLLYMKRKK